VRITDSVRGRDVDIARIEPGDFFGEVSLALHTPRTRSARTDADAEVLVIPGEAIARLARDHPHFEAGLVQAFGDRMAAREAAAD
jgi:CRP-like cAMP-binding protein